MSWFLGCYHAAVQYGVTASTLKSAPYSLYSLLLRLMVLCNRKRYSVADIGLKLKYNFTCYLIPKI